MTLLESTTLTLPRAVSAVRLDLSDTDSTAYRWSDDQIARMLSRSLDDYARVAPYFQTAQLATIAGSRIYPCPAGAWWIRSVEYPLGEWPRHYRAFRERVDGSGTPAVEVDLSGAELPADAGGTLELTYASAHVLDSAGTTVPQRHWDCLYLGAETMLLDAYTVQTNDNFDFVDGEFRDRVDDTTAPAAWRAQSLTLRTQWQQRLKEIKLEVEGNMIVVVQWGDKPRLWDRL